MPERRTRKAKERSSFSRALAASQSKPENSSGLSYSFSSTTDARFNRDLLRVDKQFIIRDLIKTIVISFTLMAILIGIYFYVRYN